MAALLCLVIEDMAPIRSLISRVLAAEGYMVVTVAGAQEARDYLSQSERLPGVVISDWNLSGECGLELAHEIKALYRIPVLLMSGQLEQEPSPDFSFLGKPFSARELIESVNSCSLGVISR